jgi:hypothetical protein
MDLWKEYGRSDSLTSEKEGKRKISMLREEGTKGLGLLCGNESKAKAWDVCALKIPLVENGGFTKHGFCETNPISFGRFSM